MRCGVIPIIQSEIKKYIFGVYNPKNKFEKPEFCILTGRKEKNETKINAAYRELYEESSGIIDKFSLVKTDLIETKNQYIIIAIWKLPSLFSLFTPNNEVKQLVKMTQQQIIQNRNNFYEKDRIIIDKLIEKFNRNQIPKQVINKIVKQEEQINEIVKQEEQINEIVKQEEQIKNTINNQNNQKSS